MKVAMFAHICLGLGASQRGPSETLSDVRQAGCRVELLLQAIGKVRVACSTMFPAAVLEKNYGAG